MRRFSCRGSPIQRNRAKAKKAYNKATEKEMCGIPWKKRPSQGWDLMLGCMKHPDECKSDFSLSPK